MNGSTIAVARSLAQRPGRGGHAWVFLQYLLGLRRLGWEVLFLDRISPEADVEYVRMNGSLREQPKCQLLILEKPLWPSLCGAPS